MPHALKVGQGLIGKSPPRHRFRCREESNRRAGPAAQAISDRDQLKALEREAKALRRGKKTVATVSNPRAPYPLAKVNREFCANRPNAQWVVDFTHVHAWAGFVYGAFVTDAYARRIVARKVSAPATAGFVSDTLEQERSTVTASSRSSAGQ